MLTLNWYNVAASTAAWDRAFHNLKATGSVYIHVLATVGQIKLDVVVPGVDCGRGFMARL